MKATVFNKSSFGSPGIIYGSGGREGRVFLGVDFGFSVVPEHQKGLEVLLHTLGIPQKLVPENFGLKMYTVTEFPEERFFFEKGKTHTCLTFEGGTEPVKGWSNEELDNHPKYIAAAWDDKSFGVVVPNKYSKELSWLYEAFKKKDAIVLLRTDQTYQIFPIPRLYVGIASARKGEEEILFKTHEDQYNKQEQESFRMLCDKFKRHIERLKAEWYRNNPFDSRNVFEVMDKDERKRLDSHLSGWEVYITPIAEAWWKEQGYGVRWPDDNSKPVGYYKLDNS